MAAYSGRFAFATIKRNEYSEAYLKLLLHFRDMLQADLKSFATLHSQLEQHEAKIRPLVDANIIGIIIWDLEGRILEANDAFLRMGGYDREDLISGRLNRTDLTPPEWRERDARTDAELKMIGAVQPFEKEYFRKDGGRVPVLIGLAAFGEERDQGVAFVLDLTELKRAEEASRESEAKFRDYAESASDWYWESDPDHKFTRLTEDERRLARGFATVSRIGVPRWNSQRTSNRSRKSGSFIGLCSRRVSRSAISSTGPHEATDLWFIIKSAASQCLTPTENSAVIAAPAPMLRHCGRQKEKLAKTSSDTARRNSSSRMPTASLPWASLPPRSLMKSSSPLRRHAHTPLLHCGF